MNGFGSRSSEGQESEIDVVIISEDFRNKDILERAAMTKDAEIRTLRKFMIPLDIVTLTPEENNTSLIAVYAKDADFISINKTSGLDAQAHRAPLSEMK